MNSRFSSLRYGRPTWLLASLALLAGLLLLGIVLGVHRTLEVPVGELTRDPAAITGVPLYTGFLSQVGIFFWAGTAAVCFFAATVAPVPRAGESLRSLLFYGGLLSFVLGVDDVFLIHDGFFPHFGVPETVVLAVYAALTLAFLGVYARALLRTDWLLLGLALGCFGTSMLLDVFELPRDRENFLLEDGAKLLGLLFWSACFWQLAVTAVLADGTARAASVGSGRSGAGLVLAVLSVMLPAHELQAERSVSLSLSSQAFPAGGEIPRRYTCEGEDVSPPLSWDGIPPDTESLALIVDDPDAPDPAAPRTTWVHWVLYDIPPTAGGLPEDTGNHGLPAGTREGQNDWRRTGYSGPCPPIGRHRYRHKLYALDIRLGDRGPLSKAALEAAMDGHVLARAELTGTYQKQD